MSVEFRQPEGLHGQSPGPGGPSRATDTDPPSLPAPWSLPRWRAYVAAAVLCYINLLNYMNWFIIAGEAGAGQAGQHLPPAAAKFKSETKLSPPQSQPTSQGEVRGPPCVVSIEVCVSSWVLWG